ncbi:MAG: FtsX-like permease family protein [Ktedonobacteraceae bacterium]
MDEYRLYCLPYQSISTANRLTNFAVLRALGMAPRQVAMILMWEQGVVYLVALLLGLGLGAVGGSGEHPL